MLPVPSQDYSLSVEFWGW